MSKGRPVLPHSSRWLTRGLAALTLVLAVTWVLFVPAADWLAHHDVGSVTGSLHETALDNARGRLLTLSAGLFAAGALIFTAQNVILSRRTVELTQGTFELTRQGQVTDRYTKAIEQLGSQTLDVRIGGIYALERIARDSTDDHPTVMEVLTAFIREHSHDRPSRRPHHSISSKWERSTRPDVQAALTVVGRRNPDRDMRSIDLTDADLLGANLLLALLSGAILRGANLEGAALSGAILEGANVENANLRGANIAGANLKRAFLNGAVLEGANLNSANLEGANLDEACLNGAKWPRRVPVPTGWELDSSGRLKRADAEPRPSGDSDSPGIAQNSGSLE
jgi:hypothetical protein